MATPSNSTYEHKFPEWLAIMEKIMKLGLLPVVFVIGVPGNILAFVILLNPRFQYNKSSIGVYTIALTFFDLCTTIFFVPVHFLRMQFSQVVLSVEFCRVMIWFNYFCRPASNITLCFMSVDRLIAVSLPLKARIICTKNRAVCSLLVVVLFQITRCTWQMMAIGMRIIPGIGKDCFIGQTASETSFHNILNLMFLVWVPLCVICLCNVVIVYFLRKNAKQRNRISVTDTTSAVESSLTLILVTISIVCLILHFPYIIYVILFHLFDMFGDLSTVGARYENVAGWVSGNIITLNSALNFYLYCLSSINFRNNLRIVVCTVCKSRKSK
ncbi:putative G-protein coupled receptor 139 [Tubulanus polymorphus]|uniref:putative G-protein coupled receptor 139 n=1 Tax=Tubulanus polymorphus TaxID=672921 RepID=UPI003DA5EB9F